MCDRDSTIRLFDGESAIGTVLEASRDRHCVIQTVRVLCDRAHVSTSSRRVW